MVDKFEIDTQSLRRDINELKRCLEVLLKAHDELIAQQGFVCSRWRGPARDAFQSQFSNDCKNYQQICKALHEVLDNMENAASTYDSTESQVKNMIAAIKI